VVFYSGSVNFLNCLPQMLKISVSSFVCSTSTYYYLPLSSSSERTDLAGISMQDLVWVFFRHSGWENLILRILPAKNRCLGCSSRTPFEFSSGLELRAGSARVQSRLPTPARGHEFNEAGLCWIISSEERRSTTVRGPGE
jgi:hypothetical protein